MAHPKHSKHEEHALFINMSNHPSNAWEQEQKDAAISLAREMNSHTSAASPSIIPVEIVDMSFPSVKPTGDEKYLHKLVEDIYAKIFREVQVRKLERYTNVVLHIMGEQGLTTGIVQVLTSANESDGIFSSMGYDNQLHGVFVHPVHSATKRTVQDMSPGMKSARFEFVRFRKYV